MRVRARPVTLAVPGDPETRTGGYAYDRRLARALRAAGRPVDWLRLPDGFPHPTPEAADAALAALAAVPADHALVIDGLAFGALPTQGLARLAAPLCALIHHPLALETGLAPDRAAALARLETGNLAHAGQVVVTSPHTAQTLGDSYGVPADRIAVAVPGVDRPDPDPGARPEAPPLILSVGSLVPRKGHDVLLSAFDRIADLDWRAVIAGGVADPAFADDLHALRARLGLDGRVCFAGALDAAELRDHFARATVFALATRYEGYGMVFAEALVHGLPIVSCRAGAVPDTVPPGAGKLVTPDDPVALAAAMRAVLSDAGVRAAMRDAATAAGAALPGWADTAARVADALDRL